MFSPWVFIFILFQSIFRAAVGKPSPLNFIYSYVFCLIMHYPFSFSSLISISIPYFIVSSLDLHSRSKKKKVEQDTLKMAAVVEKCSYKGTCMRLDHLRKKDNIRKPGAAKERMDSLKLSSSASGHWKCKEKQVATRAALTAKVVAIK